MFYGRTINKQPIPVNKRIFVLEDFDAAGLEDVVNNRSETSNEGQNSKVEDVSTKKEETNADTPKKDAVPLIKNEAKSKLTLADLLEVFDGVMEMKVTYLFNRLPQQKQNRLSQGRLMVMTTNHPEKLDPALVRPGRVDVNMEFG